MSISAINGQYLGFGPYDKGVAAGKGFQAALDSAQADSVKLKKACEGFESYFLQIMFREMRKPSLHVGELFEKSNAEKIFEDMLFEEYSKISASRGGIGLADMLYKQLTKSNS